MRGGVVQPHMDDPGSRLEAVRAPWRLNSRDYETVRVAAPSPRPAEPERRPPPPPPTTGRREFGGGCGCWCAQSLADFFLRSDLWMCGMTPPPAMVALISVSSSSSPRMASWRWRGVIRLTRRS